jgi:hypothetical protein
MVHTSSATTTMNAGEAFSATTPTCPIVGGIQKVVYGVGGRFTPSSGFGMLSQVYPSDAVGTAVTSGTALYATAQVTSAKTTTAGTLEVWAFCGNP